MMKVGIIGACGCSGEELIKILGCHDGIRLTYLADILEKPIAISSIFKHLSGKFDLTCEPFSLDRACERCDLLFLALPHTVSMAIAPKLVKKGKKVVDLSADYRLKSASLYKRWYGKTHKDTKNIKKFVYGLPELYRQKIRASDFVANPGCYPTAAILGILPVLISGLADEESIIIDAKSGVTGAGRKLAPDFLFSGVNENFKGYKINAHQHSAEIDQELSNVAVSKVDVVFSPHLLPLNRGILETIYIRLKKPIELKGVWEIYEKFYKREPFVRLRHAALPEIKDVVRTNFCDIGLVCDPVRKMLIVVSVIDNLLKGASGQAVQNMNIMCGFDERAALL